MGSLDSWVNQATRKPTQSFLPHRRRLPKVSPNIVAAVNRTLEILRVVQIFWPLPGRLDYRKGHGGSPSAIAGKRSCKPRKAG
jgi:hypothetical protein